MIDLAAVVVVAGIRGGFGCVCNGLGRPGCGCFGSLWLFRWWQWSLSLQS